MNVFGLLRYLLPLQNPLGFGLTDFVELGVAVLLVLALVSWRRLSTLAHRIAARPVGSMGLLFALPILLRLALLPGHPVPVPQTSDDFSYLLLADTLTHFRLANPMHPMRRFFETVFVLQEPSYSSIYPLGQGIALALGELIFREPWAGVLISIGSFCALVYWMLRVWVAPVWALAGGFLAVLEFGPLNQWTNNYWGGAMSAIAGCLVFGALPRLWKNARARDAALLGAGCGLQILSRPFESVLLALCLGLPVAVLFRRRPRRPIGILLLALSPAVLLVVLQNEAVTGSVTQMPYMLSRYQYGVPAGFTFQPNPIPHKELNREQQLDYQAQIDVHGDSPETLGSFCKRLLDRVRFFRFFFLPPLFLALPFFLPSLRRRRYLWAAGSVAIFELGSNCYPYYYPHYIAAVTCLFVLFSVVGLERLSRVRVRGFAVGGDAARILALICMAHFTFLYGLHLLGNDSLFIATGNYESWDFVNFGDAEGRMAINRRLAQAPGKQLVIVKLGPAHLLREWIHNDADIDRSPVVWALDLGPEEDAKLIAYYPNRTVWTAEPDAKPPRLYPYQP
jgi:hypothetical protein